MMTKEDCVTLAAVILYNPGGGGRAIQDALERAERLYDLAILTSELQHTGIVVVAAAVLLTKPDPTCLEPIAREDRAIHNARELYQFIGQRSARQLRDVCERVLSAPASYSGDQGDEQPA